MGPIKINDGGGPRKVRPSIEELYYIKNPILKVFFMFSKSDELESCWAAYLIEMEVVLQVNLFIYLRSPFLFWGVINVLMCKEKLY